MVGARLGLLSHEENGSLRQDVIRHFCNLEQLVVVDLIDAMVSYDDTIGHFVVVGGRSDADSRGQS